MLLSRSDISTQCHESGVILVEAFLRFSVEVGVGREIKSSSRAWLLRELVHIHRKVPGQSSCVPRHTLPHTLLVVDAPQDELGDREEGAEAVGDLSKFQQLSNLWSTPDLPLGFCSAREWPWQTQGADER